VTGKVTVARSGLAKKKNCGYTSPALEKIMPSTTARVCRLAALVTPPVAGVALLTFILAAPSPPRVCSRTNFTTCEVAFPSNESFALFFRFSHRDDACGEAVPDEQASLAFSLANRRVSLKSRRTGVDTELTNLTLRGAGFDDGYTYVDILHPDGATVDPGTFARDRWYPVDRCAVALRPSSTRGRRMAGGQLYYVKFGSDGQGLTASERKVVYVKTSDSKIEKISAGDVSELYQKKRIGGQTTYAKLKGDENFNIGDINEFQRLDDKAEKVDSAGVVQSRQDPLLCSTSFRRRLASCDSFGDDILDDLNVFDDL
jgi:hypothetical protein